MGDGSSGSWISRSESSEVSLSDAEDFFGRDVDFFDTVFVRAFFFGSSVGFTCKIESTEF